MIFECQVFSSLKDNILSTNVSVRPTPVVCTPGVCRANSRCIVQNNRITCPCIAGFIEVGGFCQGAVKSLFRKN